MPSSPVPLEDRIERARDVRSTSRDSRRSSHSHSRSHRDSRASVDREDRDSARRRSRHHGTRSPEPRDRDADYYSEYKRRDNRDRDSERDRDRDRNVDRDRDTDRDRDYSRRSAGEHDRPPRRDRDRDDREDYYRDSKRSRRSPSPYERDRHDRRDRNYDRGSYRSGPSSRRDEPRYDPYVGDRDPRQKSPSPELSEEQREMRSVFVSQLSARVGDRELAIFFEQNAGKVREARVIMDRISRRSKGVGYVEFVELETVQKALALSQTKLLGIPIQVQYTEAEKNRQARDSTSGGSSGPANGLYVGSLNFALTENDIRQVFQPFGPVDVVDLHKDPVTGKSKGFAFVAFKDPKDAMSALEKMNNFMLAGREIKVGLVADKNVSISRAEQQLDEGNSASLNNISRIELMQKLSRSDKPALELPAAPIYRPNIPMATTRNVLMKDAFNPEEETERDWDIELRDDVKGEVEDKYGKVLDIFVVKESQGEIYIRFEGVDSAVKAVAGLSGRWFGGRLISAAHVSDSLFDAKK